MAMDIGVSEEMRESISEELSRLLADTYTLYLKTQFFHWNVTGPHFVNLHALFETQYQGLALAADDIAERVRALGFFPPGSYKAFSNLTAVSETEDVLAAEEMIEDLIQSHEIVIRTAKEVSVLAQDGGDDGTVDLLTRRLLDHEKQLWMLKSLLEA